MTAQSIPADTMAFDDDVASVPKLAGFIHHYQNAQRVAREANRLYALSQSDLAESGLTRENIPARLAQLFR